MGDSPARYVHRDPPRLIPRKRANSSSRATVQTIAFETQRSSLTANTSTTLADARRHKLSCACEASSLGAASTTRWIMQYRLGEIQMVRHGLGTHTFDGVGFNIQQENGVPIVTFGYLDPADAVKA
jgi:hypothetical protein